VNNMRRGGGASISWLAVTYSVPPPSFTRANKNVVIFQFFFSITFFAFLAKTRPKPPFGNIP